MKLAIYLLGILSITSCRTGGTDSQVVDSASPATSTPICAENEAVVDITISENQSPEWTPYTAYNEINEAVRGYRIKGRVEEIHCQTTNPSLSNGRFIGLFTEDYMRPRYELGNKIEGLRVVKSEYLNTTGNNFFEPDFSSIFANSLADFQALDTSRQRSIIEYCSDLNYVALGVRPRQFDASILPLQTDSVREFARRMSDFLSSTRDFDIETDMHSTYGERTADYTICMTPNGDVVGGALRFHQDGCDMPDTDMNRHFENRAAAEAVGCEFSDVNWQGWGTFDYNMESLGHTDYMEWSGY